MDTCQTCHYRDRCEVKGDLTCKAYTQSEPLNRQAVFRVDGTTTSVPTKLTEAAPMRQLDLGI